MKTNYRQLKRQREDAQKKEQQAKQQRRGRVPDGAPAGGDATRPPERG